MKWACILVSAVSANVGLCDYSPWYSNLRIGRTLAIDESPTFVETWKEMEKLLETGQTASIE